MLQIFLYKFFGHKQRQTIFSYSSGFPSRKNIIKKYSLFSRASGRYFSLQIIPLPRADAIVSYGVRSAVIMKGSTHHDLIATRDKIRSTTVERDYEKAPILGVFYCAGTDSSFSDFPVWSVE